MIYTCIKFRVTRVSSGAHYSAATAAVASVENKKEDLWQRAQKLISFNKQEFGGLVQQQQQQQRYLFASPHEIMNIKQVLHFAVDTQTVLPYFIRRHRDLRRVSAATAPHSHVVYAASLQDGMRRNDTEFGQWFILSRLPMNADGFGGPCVRFMTDGQWPNALKEKALHPFSIISSDVVHRKEKYNTIYFMDDDLKLPLVAYSSLDSFHPF